MRGVAALVIGLTVSALGVFQDCPAVRAQDKPAPRPEWEFKAVLFGTDEKDATNRLNNLASEGWQYVGPLGNGLVAFRRPQGPKEQMIVEVSGKPQTVAPGEKTTITVTVRAGDRSLMPGAKVTISAGGGKFLPKADSPFDPKDRLHGPFSATGTTNEQGQWTTWWVCNPAASGYVLGIEASKEGHTSGKAKHVIPIKAVPSTPAAKEDDPKSDALAKPKLLYTHTIKDYGAEWVSFNKDETRLFILTNESTPDGKSRRLVLTLDGATGKQLQSLGIPGLGLNGAISADGTRIVLPDLRSEAAVRDLKDGTIVATLKGHKAGGRFDRVLTARFSPDGSKIVTGGGDNTAKVWDAATGKCLATFTGHTLEVASVEFSADGKFVATGSYRGEIKIWNIETGKCVLDLYGAPTSDNPTHFSADGKRVVSPRLDTPAVWNVSDGKLVQEFKGHESWVRTARFDPTGKWIVTAGLDKTVRVWDAATGKELFKIGEHTNEVSFARFSPDGTKVVTAEGVKVHVWQVPVAK
jgi:WD40 repeat protein